jgi:hypothetical protein
VISVVGTAFLGLRLVNSRLVYHKKIVTNSAMHIITILIVAPKGEESILTARRTKKDNYNCHQNVFEISFTKSASKDFFELFTLKWSTKVFTNF